MPAISASAPGKIILCGEHAVVYGNPAIALPVSEVSTRTAIFAHPRESTGEIRISAPSIKLNNTIDQLDPQHPLVIAIKLVEREIGIATLPACEIRISTTIPIAAGLGSSASVTVSLIRALSNFLGHPFLDETVNRLAFEVEKVHHGTPSGIDNTVITYQTPVFFQKGSPIERLEIQNEFTLIIADSGNSSSTADMVSGVHQRWLNDKPKYDALFTEIGILVKQIYTILRTGDIYAGGTLLTRNHELLQEIGVSTLQLDQLVASALAAGARGAKLSGSGGGGNIIALVEFSLVDKVTLALRSNGATRTIQTRIPRFSGRKH